MKTKQVKENILNQWKSMGFPKLPCKHALRVCSSEKMIPIYFLRLCKV